MPSANPNATSCRATIKDTRRSADRVSEWGALGAQCPVRRLDKWCHRVVLVSFVGKESG